MFNNHHRKIIYFYANDQTKIEIAHITRRGKRELQTDKKSQYFDNKFNNPISIKREQKYKYKD
jgi:hypothetical protein